MTKKYQINSIYEQKNSIKRFYDKIKFDDNHPTNPYGCEWSNYLEEEYTFLHYHDCLELGISHEGTGVFHINEKSIRFDGPTISIIFPPVFHSGCVFCPLPFPRRKHRFLPLPCAPHRSRPPDRAPSFHRSAPARSQS